MDNLARRGEWGGLCRLDYGLPACAERQHRRPAVDSCRKATCGPLPRWRTGWFISALTRPPLLCAERQHRRAAVDPYVLYGHFSIFARRGEWGGLCRLRERRVRAERQHRRCAVELCDRIDYRILARCGEWGGLYRV